MDRLTFISKIAEALAWPTVTLILGLAFRKRLLELLPTMKKFKAGPLEAEFELATKQLLAEASEAKIKIQPDTNSNKQEAKRQDSTIVDEMLQARLNPSGMILSGWSKIEGLLFRFGRDRGMFDDPLTNTSKVYNEVLASGYLPLEIVKLIQELKDLRNKVANSKVVPTAEAAQDYLVTVNSVFNLLESYHEPTKEKVMF